MYREKQFDAFVLAIGNAKFLQKANGMIKDLKFRGVTKILIFQNLEGRGTFQWLDCRKSFIRYLESNLIDACNLNCKACTHFAGLFKRDEIYPIDEFTRDIQAVSDSVDVQRFRLLGGEPFLLENLDEYINIARKIFPQTIISVVTNGLLIPTADQKIFSSLRQNSVSLFISKYPPTLKIQTQIEEILNHEGIKFNFGRQIEEFHKVINDGTKINDPLIARECCFNNNCRFLRHGKIYKCPIDALKFRFAEKFHLNYPPATGVDVHAKNFTQMLEMLDGNVDQCFFCTNKISMTPWQPLSNPTAQDWIA